MQRLADVFGRPLYANPEPEASIRGAAVFVIEKLGLKPAHPPLGRAIQPRRKISAVYARARVRQAELEQFLEGRK
jgi:gluconokinase